MKELTTNCLCGWNGNEHAPLQKFNSKAIAHGILFFFQQILKIYWKKLNRNTEFSCSL